MDESFEHDAAVLLFDPTVPEGAVWEYLLWPVWMYSVLVPPVRDSDLDLFEKAVLGLCRAGVRQADPIGERLRLDAELIEQILARLESRAFCDTSRAPTRDGIEALDSESFDQLDMQTGFVFQDPVSLVLWPRLANRVCFQDFERHSSDVIYLRMGSHGSPERHRAIVDWPSPLTAPRVPDVTEILEACSLHQQQERRTASTLSREMLQEREFFSMPRMREVRYLHQTARPVLLASRLYASKSGNSQMNWSVADPFGLGSNLSLRSLIERRREDSPAIDRAIDRLLSHGDPSGGVEVLEHYAELRRSARAVVAQRLAALGSDSSVFRAISAMQRSWLEAWQDLADPVRLSTVVSQAQIALEAAFQAWVRHPRLAPGAREREILEEHERTKADYQDLIRNASRDVGFDFPDRSFHARPGKVLNCCNSRSGSLRLLVHVALLTAQGDSNHPLREVAATAPGLLQQIERLARLRDRDTAHHSERQIDAESVREHVETVFRTTDLLLRAAGPTLGRSDRRD